MVAVSFEKTTREIHDVKRHPEDDPDAPWVSWQQGNQATV